jgi:hypothetical protein
MTNLFLLNYLREWNMEFANKEVAVASEQRQGEIPADNAAGALPMAIAELTDLQLSYIGGGSTVGSNY